MVLHYKAHMKAYEVLSALRARLERQEGQALVEYALILTLVSVIAIAALIGESASSFAIESRLADIVLPQVRGTLLVGLVLSFVTMLSVLSVPLMINPNSPTMITVDVAYRINTHGDYAVANALCLLSLAVAAFGAWFYLRHASRNVPER